VEKKPFFFNGFAFEVFVGFLTEPASAKGLPIFAFPPSIPVTRQSILFSSSRLLLLWRRFYSTFFLSFHGLFECRDNIPTGSTLFFSPQFLRASP